MEITKGFQIETPHVFVPWEITEEGLKKLLAESNLHKVTSGYYIITCVSLGGLNHKLGFHFDSKIPIIPFKPRLRRLEFFANGSSETSGSFILFQKHLESVFGTPSETKSGSDGFPDYTWRFPIRSNLRRIRAYHCVQDRFGLEEHVGIEKF